MSKALITFSLSRAAWRSPSNSYVSLRHISCNKGTVLFSGDVVKPITDAHEADNLYNELRTTNSTTNILRIVHDHHRKMNDKQSVQALKTIFTLQKEGKSNISTEKLINHPDFEKICRNVKRHSGIVELNDAIDTLKALSYLGVPATSTIVQVLFQIIRNNINSLSIPQILFVDFLLRSFQSTPLVEALQIALPLVFDINIHIKMNCTNPAHMADCLHYAVSHNISEESINFILKKLENYPSEFEGTTARSIISSICHLPRNPSYENLINKATNDLIVDIENVPIQKMEIVMNKLAHKYTQFYSFYYQEVLFDTCANYIIDHDIGYKRAIGVLRNMSRLHHFHKGLLDYVSTYIYEHPSTAKDPADIYSIAISIILSDYRPLHWEHLKEWIKSCKNLADENRKEIIWIRFAAALCLLDIYKIDVLSRALREDYVSHLLQKHYRSNFEHYFAIWQCITTYKPDLVELLPSNLDPKDLVKVGFKPEEFPLDGALQKALGGDQFILTNLFSKLGVQIDHAIIFSDNVPVPFKKNVEFVEDIHLENDSQQLVLIWTGTNYYYTSNTKTMRATAIKSLSILEETLKCSVIPINVDSWKELNDFEKIPYLMQKIKEKLNLNIDVLESAV